MEYSLVIPVYNEEENLFALQVKIHRLLQEIEDKAEVIYVNDCSTDTSLEALKKIAADFPEVKLISLKKHSGQSTAFFYGFKKAEGKWIITLDADLQNDPQDIKKFFPYKKNYDMINGIRENRKDSFLRRVSSRIAYWMRAMVLQDKTTDVGCSLRMFKQEIIAYLPFFRNFHRFFPFLAAVCGFKVFEVPVRHFPRRRGKTKYRTFSRLKEGVFDLIGVFWLKRRLIKSRLGDE